MNTQETPDIGNGIIVLPASFRDPSGFVFQHAGHLYRQINISFKENYELLIRSGLYQKLIDQGRMIPHTDVDGPIVDAGIAWRIIRPETVPFISYPYEWCFGQLKEAALLTLDIQLVALEHGMTLKDASAYNIQFRRGQPVMIDTLSCEIYEEGTPWVAYNQFCRHFLAPLALMARTDVQLNRLLIAYIDGVPLALASKLLPWSSWLNFGMLLHVHAHAMSQKKFSDTTLLNNQSKNKWRTVTKAGLIGIIHSLKNSVQKLNWLPGKTEWGDYYNITNYSDDGFKEKQRLVREYLLEARPCRVWDLGANTGIFSRIAADLNMAVVSFDADPSAVESHYRLVKEKSEERILPLFLDLTNPSPALGWNGNERDSLVDRGPTDCIMALALIHHLAISNNVPLYKIAEFFCGLCEHLIIEFVPKEDSQVQKLLRSRVDIFKEYDRTNFENIFSQYFQIIRAEAIIQSNRRLYLMRRHVK